MFSFLVECLVWGLIMLPFLGTVVVAKKTETDELPDGTGVLKIGQVFFSRHINYRDAISHKSARDGASLDADSQRIYSNMLLRAKEGFEPWDSAFPIPVITLEHAIELGFRVEDFKTELEQLGAGDPRFGLYGDFSEVKYIAVFGHCRQLTLLDVARDAKVKLESFHIPVFCETYANRLELLQRQAYENEGREVGVRRTTTADKWHQLCRMVDAGAGIGQQSDISKLLGVKRGLSQQLWSLWLFSKTVTNGRARLSTSAPKTKEERIYVDGGYIPLTKIDKDLTGTGKLLETVNALSKDLSRQALGSAEWQAAKAKFDAEIERLRESGDSEAYARELFGANARNTSGVKKSDWSSFSDYPADSLMVALAAAYNASGNDFRAFIAQNAKIFKRSIAVLTAAIDAAAPELTPEISNDVSAETEARDVDAGLSESTDAVSETVGAPAVIKSTGPKNNRNRRK